MASDSYTFIVVPDATSQCKRYTVPKYLFYVVGIIGTTLLIIVGIFMHTLLGEYRAVAGRVNYVEKLQKIAVSQKNTLDRYEEDILQLSKNLSHIKQLNSRLTILTGLDPDEGENNLGLGGADEGDSKQKDKKAKDARSK